jgi:putative ABC transport system substrate-binding protein
MKRRHTPSWPGLSRPSTSSASSKRDVDARAKRGHDAGRREFIMLIGGAAVWPLGARAQQPGMPVIGFLHPGLPSSFVQQLASFRQGLKEGGYVEGQNAVIEFRWGEGRFDRLPELAADLVRRRVAVITVLGGTNAALSVKAATTTVPIVFLTGADPVRDGLVASLNRPEANVTGISFIAEELGEKELGLLHELVPNAMTVGLFVNPNNPSTPRQIANSQQATRALGLQLEVVNVADLDRIDGAFEILVERRAGALLVGADPLFGNRIDQLVALAARHRIPTIYYRREYAEAGGLMSYGTSLKDAWRQVGTYTARILKGAKPSELPIMQTTKFEFVINLKTAKALGVKISDNLLSLADEVIE